MLPQATTHSSVRLLWTLVKGACPERIYPVGRLDRNTTGVIVLPNDGDLVSKLTTLNSLKKKGISRIPRQGY